MAADDGRRAVGTVLAEQLAEIECERKVPYATKAIAKREARRMLNDSFVEHPEPVFSHWR